MAVKDEFARLSLTPRDEWTKAERQWMLKYTCPKCGCFREPHFNFCPGCGKALPEIQYCQECGEPFLQQGRGIKRITCSNRCNKRRWRRNKRRSNSEAATNTAS